MAESNENQIRSTRDALLAMAKTLEKLLEEKSDDLSDDEVKKINEAITETLNKASAANAKAIQATVDNNQECVKRIADAKNSLDAALKKLDKVKNVLNIATSVVKLASAIVTGDVKTIISAAGGVVDAAKA